MVFNPRRLAIIGYANGFTLWQYDAPEGHRVLEHGYWDGAKATVGFQAGDFILVSRREEDADGRQFADGMILLVTFVGAASVGVAQMVGR